MHQESSVEIDRPIAEVFDYTLKHVPDWSLTVVEDEVIDEKPDGGVGTTFRTVTEEKGRRMEFEGRVTRHEPPTLGAVVLTGKHFDIDVEYRFEDLGGRTRVTQRSDVQGKGFTKVMFLLCGWMMKKASCDAIDKELTSLKRKAEARAPQAAG